MEPGHRWLFTAPCALLCRRLCRLGCRRSLLHVCCCAGDCANQIADAHCSMCAAVQATLPIKLRTGPG